MKRLLRHSFPLVLAACGDDPALVRPRVDAGVDAAVVPEAGGADAGCMDDVSCAPIRLAFTRLFVSDSDRGEKQSPYAWQSYGQNLDGLLSGYYGPDSPRRECIPPKGGPTNPPSDTSDGTDNVWGQTILPKLLHWDTTPTKAADAWLAARHRGPLIALGRLDGELGSSTMHAFFTYLEKGAIDPTPVVYPKAQFANGTFESGPASDVVKLELPIGTDILVLPIHGFRVKLDLGADLVASGGMLAGAIVVGDLHDAIVAHIARLSPADCSSPKLEDLIKTISTAADVLADGATDPNRECDAISFGAGFEASQVAVTSTSAGPTPEPPLPGDAGCP